MEQKVRKFLLSASLAVVLAASAGMLAGCGGQQASSSASGASASADATSSDAAGAATSAQAASTSDTGMVTLQIVNVDEAGTPTVMVNKTFGFMEGATMVDLLDAAVEDGDLRSYELNEYDFIQSFTFADGTTIANAEDFSTYWAQYENDVYYAGQDTLRTAPLADGVAYQFGIETYQEGVDPVPVDWAALDQPIAGSSVAAPEMAAAA